jgi:transposase
LAHGHKTNRPYHRPEIGQKMASKAKREGVAERFAEAAGHKTIEVDLARITHDHARLKDLERSLLKTAKHHEAHTLSLLHTVPGMGKMLRRVRLDDIHRIDRFPSVQECAASARLVKCRQESGGTRWGTSGQNIGTAPLQGAVSEAAPWCLRTNPQAQKRLARLEHKHATGKALSRLAHQLGRAVYVLRKRQVAFDREVSLQTEGSRAGAPGASRDSSGMSR